MDWEAFVKNLVVPNDTKILLVVLDGLGGAPFKDGKTELEYARTPNLDGLAAKSEVGLVHPVAPGITPGSGPSHLALFGYDPLKYNIGRGVLENLGLGVDLKPGDIAVRGNFCTVEERDGKLIVVDRRAGRIPTEENRRLCLRLQEAVREIDGVEVKFTPGMEHRFAVRLRGEGLREGVPDTDPQKTGKPPVEPVPLRSEAERLALVLKRLIERAREILKDEQKANFILLRGISELPHIPPMEELFGVKPAAIATYPMYRGLAKLVGMDVLEVEPPTLEGELEALKRHWGEYDFFYLHVKKTDAMGEDGNFEGKVKVIEEFDRILPRILEMSPDVLVVTGDHSTPALIKGHSWHPNPFLLYSRYVIPSGVSSFDERSCARGNLRLYYAKEAMPLMLAHAMRLKKFGA